MRLLRDRSTAPKTPKTASQAAAPDVPVLCVVPDLVEDSVLVEELATTLEVEAVVGDALPVSLVDEIAQAETLVSALDAEVHGGAPVRERWRTADGKTDDDLVMEARAGSEAALCERSPTSSRRRSWPRSWRPPSRPRRSSATDPRSPWSTRSPRPRRW